MSLNENAHYVEEDDSHNCTQADKKDEEEDWLIHSQGHGSQISSADKTRSLTTIDDQKIPRHSSKGSAY
jgi:hypothetical protein